MAHSSNILEIRKEKQKLCKPLNDRLKEVENQIINEMKQKNVDKIVDGAAEYKLEKSKRSLKEKEKMAAVCQILKTSLSATDQQSEVVANHILKTLKVKPMQDKNKLVVSYKDLDK